MKALRNLGFSLTVALVAICFAGSSLAIATESTSLCKINESPCASGNQVKTVHMTGSMELKSTALTVLCLSSLLTAETEQGLGHPLGLKVTGLIFSACGTNSSHNNCTLKAVVLPLFDLLKISLNYATASVLNLGVQFMCGELINCVYEGGGASWEYKGALLEFGTGHGMLSSAEWVLAKKEGFLCPAESKWTGLYEPLEHVYVGS
jgi:hypothetical protein